MPRKPARPTVSYKEFGDACGVTSSLIGQLVMDGVIPKVGNYRIPLVEGFGAYVRHLRTERRGTKTSSQVTVANARAAEINLRVAREERKLIPLDEATEILTTFLGAVRAEVENLPSAATCDPELRHKIRAKCDDILVRLADGASERGKALATGVDAGPADDEDDAE